MSTRIIIVIVVLLLVPVVAGPILIGVLLERGVDRVVDRARAAGVEIEFERGLYQSTARTRIPMAAGVESDEGVAGDLVAEHVIVHGPLPLAAPAIGRSPFDIVIVLVQSRVEADALNLPGIAEALAGEPLLQVDTRVTSVGDAVADITSQGFDFEEGRFIWGGLEGVVNVRDSGAVMDGELSSPGVRLADADVSMTIQESTLRFDADLEGQRLSASLEQAGAEWVIGDQRLATGVSRLSADQPLGGDPFGESSSKWTVDRIEGKGGLGQADFVMTDFVVEQGVARDQESGLHGAHVDIGMATWSVDGAAADGPAGFRIVLDRIERAAVERFRAALQELEASGQTPEEIDEMRPFVLLEQLPGVLASSPVFDIRDGFIEGPDGRLEGALHVTVDGSMPEMLGDPFMLLSSIDARATLRGTEPLFRRMVRRFEPEPEPEPGPAAGPADRVDAWLLDGTLIRAGDDLAFDARFENGMPTLNGAPADPMLLMSLMPGM